MTAGEWISHVSLNTGAHRKVVYYSTFSLITACARARISAFFSHASLVAWAFGTDHAFRSAIWRASNVVGQTRARRALSNGLTNGIGSTRRRHARVGINRLWSYFRWRCTKYEFRTRKLNWLNFKLTRNRVASSEWISSVSCNASTNRAVVDGLALSILTAGTRAWICALLVVASSCLSTLIANDALGSAVWRATLIANQTRADSLAINLSALAVWSTW